MRRRGGIKGVVFVELIEMAENVLGEQAVDAVLDAYGLQTAVRCAPHERLLHAIRITGPGAGQRAPLVMPSALQPTRNEEASGARANG
jgi:hypothetical protein